MTNRRRVDRCAGALLITVLLFVGGCALPSGSPADAALAVLMSFDPQGVVTAPSVQSLEPGTTRYRILAGPGEGKVITFITEAADEHGAAWKQTEMNPVRDGEATTPRRTNFLSRDDEGNILLHAVIEHDDDALSLFSPPMVVAWHELRAGESRRQKSSMRVADLNRPSRMRESGVAIRTISYVADVLLRTPAGEREAQRVVVVFDADLRFAHATETTTLFVSPDCSVIGQERHEKVHVVGLLTTDRRELLWRDVPNR